MTEREWIQFEQWLDASWRPGLDTAQTGAYRTELAGHDYEPVLAAARAVAFAQTEPGRWRPRPMEIVAALLLDHAHPTFAEAYRLLFDPQRGALIGPPDVRRARCAGLPPVVAEFARRQGGDRLRALPLDDPSPSRGRSVGEWARHELQEAWERHLRATDGRAIAALTSGTGVRRLDPLAVLGVAGPERRLAPGDGTPSGDGSPTP